MHEFAMNDSSMQPRTVENPYASPAAQSSLSVYYRMNTARLTFAELWRSVSPSYLAFLITAVAKIFNRSLAPRVGFAPELNRIIEVSDVPQHVMTKLDGFISQCEEQGFVRRFATRPAIVGDSESWNVVLANRERTVLGAALYTTSSAITEMNAACVSLLPDGRVITTSNARRRLNLPPEFLTAHHFGATVEQLIKIHTARLNELRGARPLVLDDVAQRQLLLDTAHRMLEYLRNRGVCVPLTDAELERLRTKSAPPG